MHVLFVTLVFCFARIVCSEYETLNFVIRNTATGPVIGSHLKTKQQKEAEVYFGVPYAQSPKDLLRFDYPEKVEKWKVPKNCTQPKAWCYQFMLFVDGEGNPTEDETEDCLYVNIVTPAKKNRTELLPVLVWIHGGSYNSDSANIFPVEGTVNNLVSENIVVVFINYRLGPQGFMSLGNNLLPGNVGLDDQILALEWIRDNIGYFKGDPERITLTGESAGAACVSLLALSPRTKGLFHQTIIRSGSSLAPWAVNVETTVKNTQQLLESLNCNLDSRIEILQCLQNVTIESVKHAETLLLIQSYNGILFPPFTPTVDLYRGDRSVLPDYPKNLVKIAPRLPTMAGTTSVESLYHLHVLCKAGLIDQWAYYEEMYEKIETEPFPYENYTIDWNSIFPKAFRNSDLIYQAVEQKYFENGIIPTNRTELFKSLAQALSDYYFVAPLLSEARFYAENNQPIYVYRFGYTNEFITSLYHTCPEANEYTSGPIHGTDVAMLFQSTSVLRFETEFSDLTLEDLKISRDLSTQTINFVKYGNPNGMTAGSEENLWILFKAQDGESLHIDSKENYMQKADNCSTFWLETVPVINEMKQSPLE